jgi:uncharacterized protein
VRVAVTGSSGLIGSALLPVLRRHGHEPLRIVRREPAAADEIGWDPEAGTIDVDGLTGVDAIVNLAGETIGRRWTPARKRRIADSRVGGTRLLAEAAAALEQRPQVFLCASGIGFYGDRGDAVLTEAAAAGTGFLAQLAEQWQAAAQPARDAGMRVVTFRHGIVLSRRGGALVRLLLPFRLGLGGRVGSGEQWWSWIAIDDAVEAYAYALEHPLAGPVNLVSPEPVRNRDFATTLARALGRPAIAPFPAFAVRAVFGEMGEEVLLASQRAAPAVLEASGFTIRHRALDDGIASALAA